MSSVTINGNTYNVAAFNGYGYIDNIFNLAEDQVVVAGQVQTNANTVDSDKDIVAADKAIVLGYKNDAEAARDDAEAAAVSTQFPVFTSSGTGSAYTITDEYLTIGDGTAIRMNFHAENLASPTLEETTDGNAYEIVDKGNRSLDAGEVASGATYILLYDTAINKWIIQNLALYKLVQALDANGQKIETASLIDTQEEVHNLGNVSGAVAVDYTNGHYQKCVATGNITGITISNWPSSGKAGWLTLQITQDGTGGRTLTLGAAYKTEGGISIALSGDASARDKLRFETDDAGTTIDTFINQNLS